MTDENTKKPERGCLACSVGITLAAAGFEGGKPMPPGLSGWETVLAISVVELDGVEVVKTSLCSTHALMMQRAQEITRQWKNKTSEQRREISARADEVIERAKALSGKALAALISDLKPGQRSVGTCGICKRVSAIARDGQGALQIAHEEPACDEFKNMSKAVESLAGLPMKCTEGVMNVDTGDLYPRRPEDRPS